MFLCDYTLFKKPINININKINKINNTTKDSGDPKDSIFLLLELVVVVKGAA